MEAMMNDRAKVRAIFALEQLQAGLRSRVLADGSIASRFGIGVNSPVRILNKTVDRQHLFARFREAADGKTPAPLVELSGQEVDARIEVDAAGDGTFKMGGTNIRFPHSALLASDAARRGAYAERMLADYTLTGAHQRELLALTAHPAFSDKEFFQAVGILSATPETFARLFAEKLEQTGGNIGESQLLPDDPRYWESLTAEPGASPDLRAFIAAELAAERSAQLNAHPPRAFRTLSLSFCAPALVPKELLDELPADSVLAMMEQVAGFDDPFALVGSFEYCAACIDRDPRFAALGDKLLFRLVGDMNWLRRAAAMWAAAFVVATARLALHEHTRSRPVHWRRLAAASHASLVVRTCGVHEIDPSDILAWAVRMRGLEYHCSILRDMAAEPSWRPEWADPGILTADIFSRAYGAFRRIPESVAPATWGECLTKGLEWIKSEKLTLYLTAPAVLEGGLRRSPIRLTDLPPELTEVFQRFIDDPDAENLVAATAATQRHGAPPEIIPAAMETLARIRKGARNLDDRLLRTTLGMAGHLALLTGSGPLADAVVQTVLDCSRGVTRREAADEAAFRIIEASGAMTDPAARETLLCQALLALANILPPNKLLEDLGRLLDALTQVDPNLAAPLARAIHTARLGAPSPLL
jgi:hypothetical protein